MLRSPSPRPAAPIRQLQPPASCDAAWLALLPTPAPGALILAPEGLRDLKTIGAFAVPETPSQAKPAYEYRTRSPGLGLDAGSAQSLSLPFCSCS